MREILPDADVMVHSVPRARHTENIFDRIRAVAHLHNFNVHDISVQDLNGRTCTWSSIWNWMSGSV